MTAIIAKGLSVKDVAKTVGIRAYTLYRKMNGESDFFRDEILTLCHILGIEDPVEIFLLKNLRKRKIGQTLQNLNDKEGDGMNDMQVFKHTEFGELTVLQLDGREYFPATPAATMLGYVNARDVLARHCRSVVKHDVPHPQSPDKTIEMNFIPEGDLYRLIVKSQLPTAEKFERWVFDEVLPTIRRHGVYATPATIETMLSDPDAMITMLQTLKAERAEKAKLQLESAMKDQIICELQPKASYYDLILQNRTGMAITNIAKDYGMSAQKMNQILHDLKVQYKTSDTWFLYQDLADKGFTSSKTVHYIDSEGEQRTKLHTNWTRWGRLFIYHLLKSELNIVPLVERVQEAKSN